MLIAFDLIGVVVSNVLTLLTAMGISSSDSAFAFGRIVKERLFSYALLAGDHEIPLKGTAFG